MGTMQLHQAYRATQITENHQFFPEYLDPMGQILQFVGEADRLPEAPQIFAARRVRADVRKLCVFVGQLAMEVAAKSRPQENRLW